MSDKTSYYEYDIEKMGEDYFLKIRRIVKGHLVGDEKMMFCSASMLPGILKAFGFPDEAIEKALV